MNERCIICEHPRTAHFGTGCHTDSFLRGRCDCDFVELPALPESATPAQYRARAAWWQQRAEMAETRQRRTRMGTERWWRLDRFVDAARSARSRGLDMAAALEAEAITPATEAPGDDLLDLMTIETIATQQPATLQWMLEQLERSDVAARDALRTRLTAEFDALEPRYRRELLEDETLRRFLEQSGVVSAWSVSVPTGMALAPLAALSTGPTDRQAFLESVESELDETIGDEYEARTEGLSEPQSHDEAFIRQYMRTRADVEAYWRHWAQAPSPQALVAYIAMDPDEFKRYLALAVEVLTPAERSRFSNRHQLNGWIASGMQPLSQDGQDVPLEAVIDPGYLPATAF
ncbi:MAG: hypothetical protein ABWZ82_05810 [Candidatus Limnocylindrales bacterium]